MAFPELHKLLRVSELKCVCALWPAVEFPSDDVCVEDCTCSLLWQHCGHQACRTDSAIRSSHGCTDQRGTLLVVQVYVDIYIYIQAITQLNLIYHCAAAKVHSFAFNFVVRLVFLQEW